MKRRIALVYDAIYPYVKGGAERRFYEFARYLTEQGYDVHLYGMKYWDGPNTIVRDGITLHGLMRARPLYTTGGRRSIGQALRFGLASLKLIGERFDIIDCCGFPYFSLFGAKLAAMRNRAPLVSTWHEVWGKVYWREYLGKLGPIGYLIELTASRLPNHIIAASNQTLAGLTKLGYHGKVSLVANGVDTAELKATHPNSKRSDVMYAGRLVDFKNVDLLIRAAAILAKKHPQLKVTIVGDGPARPGLEALTAELGLQKTVTFTGFVKEASDVYSHMKASRVFVSPSAREGFGITIIEAAAAGLPVVTADFPGNAGKDLITPATGRVATPTPADIATAVDYYLSHRTDPKPLQEFATNYEWPALGEVYLKALS